MAATLPLNFSSAAPATIAAGNLTRDLDLTAQELNGLLDLAGRVKSHPARFAQTLTGNYISLLFEKPSLRTRLTFELAIKQLGGDAVTTTGTTHTIFPKSFG